MDAAERLTVALADRYRIERELGQGGMATVYLAHDLKHNRNVAIKVLKPELAAVLGADRFVQEIATTAALQHPNILPLFDSGTADGFLFYVMPFVEGETLRTRLDRETQLGIDESVKITVEVADALDYAHRHGVVHRDIKPENILLHDGHPMVADFGIALAVSAAAGGRMTETGLSLGTPYYMSPEQATAEKDITARSDIYSLGTVLYEMLAGQPPHLGGSAQQIIMKIVTEEPAPVTRLRKSVPPNAAAAVSKALEKVPADRFDSAKAFAAALENPHFTTASATSAAASASSAKSLRALIQNPWSWAGFVLAAAVVVGTWAATRATRSPSTLDFTQLTYDVQAIYNARFAADGKTIVFSAAGAIGQTPRLYVIRPDNPDAVPLGQDSVHLLSVSATGQVAVLTHAVYVFRRLFTGTLATLPLGGEAPRELENHVREADWAPNGKDMAVIRDTNNVDHLEYPEGTVIARSSGYLSDVRVSPSGDAVAYFEHPVRYDDRGFVVIVDRAGRKLAQSTSSSGLEGMTWRPDGQAVLFSSGPSSGIVREMTRGSTERTALTNAGSLTVQDESHAGRMLVTQDEYPVQVFARGLGATTEKNLGIRDYSVISVLSDDGKYLAFSDAGARGGANYTLMLRRTDGSPEISLGDGQPIGFSADGNFVLASIPSTPPRLVLYPTGVGHSRQLNIGKFDELTFEPASDVVFDHDSRFFFCGARRGELGRCYVGSVDTDSVTPVTPPGTRRGWITPDGGSVLAVGPQGPALFPVAGGAPGPMHGLQPGDVPIRWSPDGHEAWVARESSDSALVLHMFSVNPETGARAPLTTIVPQNQNGLRSISFISLANDPRVYAYTRYNYTSLLFTVDGVK
jgi:hypothetical protein